MRRAMLLLVVMAVALVLAGGAALAVTKTGNDGNNVLRGTDNRDALAGGGGGDRLYGEGARDILDGDSGPDWVYGGDGHDQLFGGQGFDRVFGSRGHDFINVLDEDHDVVDCGRGRFDEVYMDEEDEDTNCEVSFVNDFERPRNAEDLGPQELSALPARTFVEEQE